MWDRDDTQPWSWKTARWQINHHCNHTPNSSTYPSQSPPNKECGGPQSREPDSSSFHAFRSYVDREIAKDPYGLLFGKRLESPPSTNNSSWTSFSWIFQPKEQTLDQGSGQTSQQPLSSDHKHAPKQSSPSSTNPSTPTNETTRTSDSATEEEYEYDPITMRKVLKTKETAEPTPEQPFLKSLFAEHGVDIPVKTYKPHRVFGYGSDPTPQPSPKNEATSNSTSRFGSSRKAELASLMAQSKGNSIDTTAQFTDIPAHLEVGSATSKPEAHSQSRESPEPDDSSPLFSGTTYEARSQSLGTHNTTATDWLSKEGFRPAEKPSIEGKILEPALDRMVSAGVEGTTESGSTNVDRSADQIETKPVKENQNVSKRAWNVDLPDNASEEDIDLLRASDIRAATKTARVSKQQLLSSKQRVRSKLEANFTAHQVVDDQAQNGAAANTSKTAGQISKSLTNIWKHIKDYPGGIVARTMQSMSSFNDDYKKYVKPNNTSHLTDKLVFKDEGLSKTPSIYKTTPTPSVKLSSPSPTVEKEIQEQFERMERLKAANKEVENANKTTDAQLSQLAVELRAIYEEERGPISQESTPGQAESGALKQSGNAVFDDSIVTTAETTHPEHDMQEPRVETSQIQDELPSIESAHEQSARLKVVMDGTKELRRELHETGMAIRAIESGRPSTVWNSPSPISTNFGKKRMELTDRRPELKKAEQENIAPTPIGESDCKSSERNTSSSPKEETPTAVASKEMTPTEVRAKKEAPQEAAPKEVPPPIFTPSGSSAWNDEQPPSIESLKEQPLQSPYAILARDGKRIVLSPSDTIPLSSDAPSGATLILSKLRYAAYYLPYFERLDKDGYELYSGARNMLIFKRRHRVEAEDAQSPSNPSTSTRSISPPPDSVELSKQAAMKVHDISGAPDSATKPAVAPEVMARPSKGFDRQPSKSKVRRQEEVFSGTKRPWEDTTKESEKEGGFARTQNGDGVFTRLTRTVRRAMLTILALGGAAYTVGFIAEGIGAQAQIQNGVDDGQVPGPRKRVVMNGQRPGIYSTESSR